MLKDILNKLRVSDLQNEIRKVLADFKGFKNMTKKQLIEVMLENESLFKHLDKVDTTEFKKSNVIKPKGKIQKQRAEDKPIKQKLKKEPTEYVTFVKKYRMKNNLSLKDAMKEIKEKGLYVAKTPAIPKKSLNKEEKQQKLDNSVRRGIKKKLLEYMKTVTDDPSTRDKTQFIKLKKIIGKKTAVQKKKRRLLKDKSPNIYNKLKELDFFQDIDIDKEESKYSNIIKKTEEKIDPNDFSYLGITNEEAEELLGIKKKPVKKELTLVEKLNKLNILLNDLEDTIANFPKNRNDDENNKRIKLLNKKAALLDNIKSVKNKLRDMEDGDMSIDEFKIIVKEFIQNPTDKLNDEILDNVDLIDELSEKETDNLNKALDRFEEGEEEPEPAKKNKPKIKLVTFHDTKQEAPKQEAPKKEAPNKIKNLKDELEKLDKQRKKLYKKTEYGVEQTNSKLETKILSKMIDIKDEIRKHEKKLKKSKKSKTLKQKEPINIMNETKQTIKYKRDDFLPLTAVQFLTKVFKISNSERKKMDINKEAELRKRWLKNYMQSQEDEKGFNYEIKDWIQDTSKFLKANSDTNLEELYQKQKNNK